MARFAFGLATFYVAACSSTTGDGLGSGGGTSAGGFAPGAGGATSGGATSSVGGATTGGASSGGATVGGASTGGGSSGGAAQTGGTASADGGAASGGSGSGGETADGGTTGSGGGSGEFEPPTGDNSIAYTGCSMANNIGNGYKRVGGKRMWNSDNYQTGAMIVQNWTNPSSSSWNLFDQKMNASGGKDNVKAIMVQICIASQRATEKELRDMVAAARQHVNPGTHIYIVGQPTYNAGHDCFIAGTGGADWTDQKAQELAADDSINENMTYLGKFVLDNDNGEVSDGCHASTKGEDVLGNQAKAFFGG